MTGGNCTPVTGCTSWGDLFTPRQLVALDDILRSGKRGARSELKCDALASRLSGEDEASARR